MDRETLELILYSVGVIGPVVVAVLSALGHRRAATIAAIAVQAAEDAKTAAKGGADRLRRAGCSVAAETVEEAAKAATDKARAASVKAGKRTASELARLVIRITKNGKKEGKP